MTRERSHYEVLCLPQECDAADVKRAYRRLALEFHPDRGNSRSGVDLTSIAIESFEGEKGILSNQDEFMRAHEAYKCLMDEKRRRAYDAELTIFLLRNNGNAVKYLNGNASTGASISGPRERWDGSGVIWLEVDLDDMDVEEESETVFKGRKTAIGDQEGVKRCLYSYSCKCGGVYSTHEDELAVGIDTVGCNGCSCRIKILYESSISNESNG